MNEILMFLILILSMNILNFLILSNLMFLMSLLFLMNMSWIKWIFIFSNLSINNYSNYLILLMFWIFGMIFLNLNKYKMNCLIMNLLLILMMMINFMSMDLLIFYFMYEFSLLLIFFMIMEWGYTEDRVLSSFYLMFYTLIFSLPMLYLIFKILDLEGSMIFFFLELMNLELDKFNYIYLLMSFLVKIPMYLFHGWLVKAHVEASFFSSMILASIMLKLGSYGMLRLIFMFKFMLKNMLFFLMLINIFGLFILSILCLIQFDMKLIIALSSVVHMGIMMMGMLMEKKMGILGGLLMMISHGLVSSGLFYLVNTIYMQTNSRLIFINKGMICLMPSMSMMWFMMCVYNSGAPISLNMVSEIFLLMSLIYWCKYLFLFLIFYCLFSFIYSIYLFSFIQYGKIFYLKLNIYNSLLMNYLTLILHLLPLNLMIFNLFF
uniref:NADH-ubiquinone oxidoreductase chain 4 n=1 Tax=Bombus filchnerae TaxID=395525 RepID=A0A8E5HI03_9HYME|nr:NADH dehydrogenase subunit 4 [Bombus filchnerae]QTZ18842.1 NADH dehydrogenase subunit 4 [Bombus filchnerae]WKW52609.1 NADH dehydrogenase subunit 4 [Bombus filchnerae]